MAGINVPGYHLHFQSPDRTQGGHILDALVAEGRCEIEVLDRFVMALPSDAEAFAGVDLSEDRSAALNSVEQ